MLFPILLISFSVSLDSLGVGISYGMRNIKIPLPSKMLMCFFSIFYTSVALILGKTLYDILNPNFSKWLGFCVLCFMGVFIIFQSLIKRNTDEKPYKDDFSTLFKFGIKSLGISIHIIKNPHDGDLDRSGKIDKFESVLLSLALSIDAIGVGIGSALANIYSLSIPVLVAIFQFMFLSFGDLIGRKIQNLSSSNSMLISLLPGFLLIILAILVLAIP